MCRIMVDVRGTCTGVQDKYGTIPPPTESVGHPTDRLFTRLSRTPYKVTPVVRMRVVTAISVDILSYYHSPHKIGCLNGDTALVEHRRCVMDIQKTLRNKFTETSEVTTILSRRKQCLNSN